MKNLIFSRKSIYRNFITVKSIFLLTILPSSGAFAAAGTGVEPTFMEKLVPFWPFIISLAVFLLVILWYQSIKINSKKKNGGRQTKGSNILIIVGIIVIMVAVLFAIPWFMDSTDAPGAADNTELIISPENRTEVMLTVDGMTCTGCENLIQRRVGELSGIESVVADHQGRTTIVVFDSTITDLPVIIKAIEKAGYTVENHEIR